MKKYFFVAFKATCVKLVVGGGSILLVCSCGIRRMDEVLLDYYNKRASFGNMADKVVITSLTVLDKQTAAQLSNNFTDNSLIIDDGEKEEEQQEEVLHACMARDKDGTLYLYVGNNYPRRGYTYWTTDDGDCLQIEPHFFPEVQWSDEEPTKVKLLIDK